MTQATAAPCLIVMGPFRSGTSLVSRIVSELGVDFGPPAGFQLPADRYNPGGYFQRRDVVESNRKLVEASSPSIAAPNHPTVIQDRAGLAFRPDVDFTWVRPGRPWGMKDPRFSVTLHTWIRAGVLDARSLRIVRVRRRLDAVAKSCVQHPEVGSFCDHDPGRTLAMVETYDRFAAWHAEQTGLPAYVVEFERLIAEPSQAIQSLAEFIAPGQPDRARRCVALVGKRRTLVAHYLKKLTQPALLIETVRKTLGQRRP